METQVTDFKKRFEFNPTTYEENNELGIRYLKALLIKKGYSIYDKPKEDYAVDIIACKREIIYHFEAEIRVECGNFSSRKDFPYVMVNFLTRKKRFIQGDGFWYCIFSKDGKCMIICHSSKIYQEKYRKKNLPVNTKDFNGYDDVYRLPKEECLFYDLVNCQYICE